MASIYEAYAANAVSNAARDEHTQQAVGSHVAAGAKDRDTQARVGAGIAASSENPVVRAAAGSSTVQSAAGSLLAFAATNRTVQSAVGDHVAQRATEKAAGGSSASAGGGGSAVDSGSSSSLLGSLLDSPAPSSAPSQAPAAGYPPGVRGDPAVPAASAPPLGAEPPLVEIAPPPARSSSRSSQSPNPVAPPAAAAAPVVVVAPPSGAVAAGGAAGAARRSPAAAAASAPSPSYPPVRSSAYPPLNPVAVAPAPAASRAPVAAPSSSPAYPPVTAVAAPPVQHRAAAPAASPGGATYPPVVATAPAPAPAYPPVAATAPPPPLNPGSVVRPASAAVAPRPAAAAPQAATAKNEREEGGFFAGLASKAKAAFGAEASASSAAAAKPIWPPNSASYVAAQYSLPAPVPIAAIQGPLPAERAAQNEQKRKEQIAALNAQREAEKEAARQKGGWLGKLGEAASTVAQGAEQAALRSADAAADTYQRKADEASAARWRELGLPPSEHLQGDYACRVICGRRYAEGYITITNSLVCFSGSISKLYTATQQPEPVRLYVPLASVVSIRTGLTKKAVEKGAPPTINMNELPPDGQPPATNVARDAILLYASDGSLHQFYSFRNAFAVNYYGDALLLIDHHWRKQFQ